MTSVGPAGTSRCVDDRPSRRGGPRVGHGRRRPVDRVGQGQQRLVVHLRRRRSGGQPGRVRPLGLEHGAVRVADATQWAFAGGSTTAGNNLALALFDPAAPDAVVNISFLTRDGAGHAPGLPGPGRPPGPPGGGERRRLRAERASDIATLVSAQAGALVSSEFQQSSVGGGGGLSLRLGSPGLSTVWRFAQTTAGPGSAVDFHLANPGTRTVTATIARRPLFGDRWSPGGCRSRPSRSWTSPPPGPPGSRTRPRTRSPSIRPVPSWSDGRCRPAGERRPRRGGRRRAR